MEIIFYWLIYSQYLFQKIHWNSKTQFLDNFGSIQIFLTTFFPKCVVVWKTFFYSTKIYVFNNTKLSRKCYSKKWKIILGYFPEILDIFHVFFVEKFLIWKNTFFQKSFRFSLIFGNFYFLFLNKNILGKLCLN